MTTASDCDVRIESSIVAFLGLPARVGVRLEVQLPTASIGYVRVELGRGEIGVAEHLLDGAEVCAALQQMRGERVPEQVRMDALGLEAGLVGEGRRIRNAPARVSAAALGVEEQLGRWRVSR